MPFPLKIQPVDFNSPIEPTSFKPVVKSRFKRLFERPFANVLRISVPPEKVVTDAGAYQVCLNKDVSDEFEPSSVCLADMVQNFIEENNEKQSSSVKCCRSRCYCFNASDGSDGELDCSHSCPCKILKSLVICSSALERSLLADTADIVEKNKISKCKDDSCRKLVTDGLLALGYDASICKARWEKSTSYPAGEYDYVDVIKDGERVIIDIDFRSEFEIARSTKTYKTILQTLPNIFVGKADRLQKIIKIVSEAAKQSLKKKGMPFPPWRTADYVQSKWLSPYTRTPQPQLSLAQPQPQPLSQPQPQPLSLMDSTDSKIFSQTPVIEIKKINFSNPVTDVVNSSASSDHCGDTVFTMSEEDEDP